MKMKTYKIFRAPPSRYFAPDFVARERALLESLPGIQWVDELAQADIFISNTHTAFEELAPNGDCQHLQLIIHPNSGFDRLAYSFVQQCRATIVTGNLIRAEAVSNYILRSLLQATGAAPYTQAWDHQRAWPRRLPQGLSMRLVGHGHIGRLCAQWATALGLRVDSDDPYLQLVPKLPWQEVDVVVLACSLNRHNKGLINNALLAQLKDDAIIINPARGELVVFEDLLSWLEQHPRAQAFVDAFAREPYPPGQFPALKNLHCSSHVAGVFSELDHRTIEFEYDILKDFLAMAPAQFAASLGSMNLKTRRRDDFLYE